MISSLTLSVSLKLYNKAENFSLKLTHRIGYCARFIENVLKRNRNNLQISSGYLHYSKKIMFCVAIYKSNEVKCIKIIRYIEETILRKC